VKAFLSYAHDDAEYAATLRRELERQGLVVWDGTRDMAPGSQWAEQIRQALNESDALIQIVPKPGAAQSNNVWFEAGAAKALDKSVFAVTPDARGREPSASITDFAIFDASAKPLETVAKTLIQALRPAA
jgi:TIR domain